MAGDWIKVESVMPDKPEVGRLAEILNLDHDAVVGKLVRFWIWADSQLRSGNALSVTPALLDRITYCNGFVSALVQVGWLTCEDGVYSVPNFDRHNGQTAKDRALTKNRVQRSRNAASVTESLPEKRREEKRRENKESPKPPSGASMTPREFFDRWNKFASSKPRLKPCRKMTGKREDWIRKRLSESGWLDDFREAVKLLPLAGQSDDWQPDFDWLVKSEHNIYRLLEGSFDWRTKGDMALAKLEKDKRRRAAEERQVEVEQQKQADRQSAPKLRSAIDNILDRANGCDAGDGVSSLLSG